MTADTYSTDGVGVLLMGTGNDNNTWGANANSNVFQVVVDAITNALTSSVTGGTLDLSGSPPPAASSQARYAGLIFSGTLTGAQSVKVPNLNKWWLVQNATAGAFALTFKTPSGSASTSIPQNSGWQVVQCDGANNIVVSPFNTVQVQMPNGTAAAPAYSWVNEANTGWYRAGSGDVRYSFQGTDQIKITTGVVNIVSGALQVGGGAVLAAGSTVLAADGSQSAPGLSFSSETGSGLYRIGAGQIGCSVLNTQVWKATTTLVTFPVKVAFTSTDSMAVANGTTGQRNGTPTAGDTRYNSTLNGLEYWNGTAWIVLGQAPTVQRLTSGSSATCTPSTGVVRWRVRMCGAGGGGGASTTNSGGDGSDTSFGSWTAKGGKGGLQGAGAGGAGGTGGATGTGTLVNRADGGSGSAGQNNTGSSFSQAGGGGGCNPFGGAGGGAANNAAGSAAGANTGGGGGGGGLGGSTSGSGGGAGEYVEFWVNNPSATTYTIGTKGNGGAAGSHAGGNGGDGIIIVEEFYA